MTVIRKFFTSYPNILRYKHESALYRYSKKNGKNIKIIFDNVEILSDAPISIYNKKLFMLSNK